MTGALTLTPERHQDRFSALLYPLRQLTQRNPRAPVVIGCQEMPATRGKSLVGGSCIEWRPRALIDL